MTSLTARLAASRPLMILLSFLVLASAGCAKQEESKEERLSRAENYVAAGKYEEAEKEYRNVLGLAPNHPVGVRQLGLLYYEQSRFVQAYPLLKQAAELHPDDVDVHLKLGVTHLAARENSQAREAALRVLEKQPGHEQALLLLANTALEPNDIAEIRRLILNLREQDQQRSAYHLALGGLDLRERDAARAEQEFKAALQLNPRSLEAYLALASLHWSRNDLKAAEQAFKSAVDLDARHFPARLGYAEFLRRTGAPAEAKKILEDINRLAPGHLQARVYLMTTTCAERLDEDCATRVENILGQDPLNYAALFQKGILSLQKGDGAMAVRVLSQLSNTYRNPQVLYQLARAYLLSGQSAGLADRRTAQENAEVSLNDALKLDANFDQASLLLAEIKMRKGSAAAAADLLAPLTQKRPPIAQAHSMLATAHLAQRKSEEALVIYRKMSELFPQDPQPPFLAGVILLSRGQQGEARTAFEKSAEISPDYLPPTEKLVELEIAAKEYASALGRVQKHIDNNPKLAQPWAIRAKIYLAQQDFSRAEADLSKAIDLDPNQEASHLLLGLLYVNSGRHQEAIERLTAFSERSKSLPALLQLAEIYQLQKNFRAAGDAYEKMLAVNPNVFVALNNLAVLNSEHLGRLDAAYDLARKARDLAPNEPRAADTLGWVLYRKGEYGNALRLLQESASKLPENPEIQFHLGMAHYMLGEEEPARVALQKAVTSAKDFPDQEDARRRLAVLAINPETPNAATRTELDNYLRERPNDPAALVRLAGLQERDGAVDEAVRTYQKILSGYPLFAPANRGLALLYGQRAIEDTKAVEVATRARQAYPNDPQLAKILGIVNYRRGYYPQSAEQLEQAAAKRRDDAELLFYLGQAHYQLKQWNECKRALELAVTLNLSPELAERARPALAACSGTSPE